MAESLIFYSLAALVLLSALAVVTMRNTVHSALFLGLSLAGLAGIFAELSADFLFAAQILVYVGGIAVLFIFVVMLLGRASDLHLRQINAQWPAALLVCAVAAAGLWRAARSFIAPAATRAPAPTTERLGRLLMGGYAVPFELVSLLLTAALLGAVFFSRLEKNP
ncbi:MAG: NADH-quinone oxidoreductase subunit J [Elusimicrobia bacterium]|nr:NADH-quinone oxidoreductase subunit J [Elusimicrobiota bacterium]MDE2237309.1 NADH-quinone oxidoreductase subunit J [Elusimicrobiota bacterium]MDE2425448.1 NADH-quinone oxidoreductase subunit J [Elusimicrobiota bacterium]